MTNKICRNREENGNPPLDYEAAPRRKKKRSIVDKSILQDNDELANNITDVAVKCLNEDPNECPDMKEVYANLSNLVGTSNKSIMQEQ